MNNYKDKVAVVTGASGGIGRALAERCAVEGMNVVLADVDKKGLTQTEKELMTTGSSVLAVEADVSDIEDVKRLAQKTIDTFGAVHLLCNAVGVHRPVSIAKATPADWQWVVGVNLNSAIYTLNTFLPIMFEQDTEAHIVNTSSVLGGFCPLPFNGPYNVSQFGIVTLFEVLYLELCAKYPKIKVSLLVPDFVDTGFPDLKRRHSVEPCDDSEKSNATVAIPDFEKIKDIIETTVYAETPPKRLADMVFEALEEGTFYIFPHPESNIIMRDRLERIEQEQNPENILKLMGIVG